VVPSDPQTQPTHADGHPDLIVCAGAVVRDGAGRILLVRRANPPAAGSWTLPGGRVEADESPAQAAAREVAEETGLVVEVGALLATVPVLGFLVHDFAATVVGGELCAGDDAIDARWFDVSQLGSLALSDGLLTALREMGAV
jgi:8-oxo-dGTP diphosphatase